MDQVSQPAVAFPAEPNTFCTSVSSAVSRGASDKDARGSRRRVQAHCPNVVLQNQQLLLQLLLSMHKPVCFEVVEKAVAVGVDL